jgi:hypothetical protein
LSLQSDKYGYRPLPHTLDAASLDKHLKTCYPTPDELKLYESWYKFDGNSLPAKYVLRHLDQLNDPLYWKKGYPVLAKLLEGLPCYEEMSPGLLIGRSITEWEVTYANSSDSGCSRVRWFHRCFSDPSPDKPAFCDTGHPTVAEQLQALKAWMTAQIPSDKIVSFPPLSLDRFLSPDIDDERAHYLSCFTSRALSLLATDVEDVVAVCKEWNRNGCGLGLAGAILSEFLHHCEWAADRCSLFVGREKVLDEAKNVIKEGDRKERAPSHSALMGISLCVIGKSGAGKCSIHTHINP